jgi:hypothetical protein
MEYGCGSKPAVLEKHHRTFTTKFEKHHSVRRIAE